MPLYRLTQRLGAVLPHRGLRNRFGGHVLQALPRRHQDVTVVLPEGVRMTVDFAEILGFYLYLTGSYEPEILDFFRTHVRPGDVFLDVGGHFGLHALLASRLVGPTGAVHTFEPGDRQRRLLELNVR